MHTLTFKPNKENNKLKVYDDGQRVGTIEREADGWFISIIDDEWQFTAEDFAEIAKFTFDLGTTEEAQKLLR